MRLNMVTILSILIASAYVCQATSHIEFEVTTFNVGEVKAGKEVTVSFNLTNTGDELLKIIRARGECSSCLAVKATQTVILPGEAAAIKATFTTSAFGGDISKGIVVDTNDPVNPSTKLMITGKAIPVAIVSPKRLNVGNLPLNSTTEYSILITPTNPVGFSVVRLDAGGEFVKPDKIKKANDGKGSYIVTVKVQTKDSPGRIYEYIKIVTKPSDNPAIPLLIYGNIGNEPSNDITRNQNSRK